MYYFICLSQFTMYAHILIYEQSIAILTIL